MIACRLTPLKHSDISDIEQCIIPPSELKPDFKGSFVTVILEPNEYANKDGAFFGGDRLAVSVYCQGRRLGYVPELYSVTEWRGEHDKWTRSVEAVRNQLSIDYMNNGTTEFSGHVCACRYISHKDGMTKYCTYDEYMVMEPEAQKDWKLEQVAVIINGVEGE